MSNLNILLTQHFMRFKLLDVYASANSILPRICWKYQLLVKNYFHCLHKRDLCISYLKLSLYARFLAFLVAIFCGNVGQLRKIALPRNQSHYTSKSLAQTQLKDGWRDFIGSRFLFNSELSIKGAFEMELQKGLWNFCPNTMKLQKLQTTILSVCWGRTKMYF
jgi:hypothetical protein